MTTRAVDYREDVSQSLPPGPTLSSWDQAKAWIERPIEFWTECQQTYGGTFTVQFGSLGPTVLFCDPDDIQQIFGLPSASYECRSFNGHYQLIMGSQSILALDGEEHWQQRRAVAPSFQGANLADWTNVLQMNTERLLRPLRDGDIVHVRRLVHEISFSVILHLLFRDNQAGIRRFLSRIFSDYMVREYGTWSPWARFASAHPALRTMLGAEIRRQRNTPVGESGEPSLFDRLVRSEHSDEAISESQIEDHIFTMLIAGVDPSAIATTWAIYWVHSRAEVLGQLRKEVHSRKNLNTYIQEEQTYLHQVCLETLRMYPVVTTPSGRKLLCPTEIGGRTYPAGVTLLPCTYLAHRQEQVFSRPDEFLPERFAGRAYRNCEFFPFGGGRRICIGARLATVTMKAILAALLRNLEMGSHTEGPVVPIRHGTLLAPSDNFRLQIERRTGPRSPEVP